MLSLPAHERLNMTTLVLSGLVRLIIRSPRYVWVMSRFLTSRSEIVPPWPARVTVEVTVVLSRICLGTSVLAKSRIAHGVPVAVTVRVLVGGVPVKVGVAVPQPPITEKRRPQPLRVPVSIVALSLTVKIHRPSPLCPLRGAS